MPLARWRYGFSESSCSLCGSANTVLVFPAILGAPGSPGRATPALEGEAACFDHPNKRAETACGQCGRYLCRLCAVEFGKEIWCPSCVAAGSGPARAANLETSRTLYDSIALTAPLASLVAWPLNAIAAPAALVIAITKWKRPLSLVRRTHWRFVAAIAISLVEIGLWTLLALYLATRLWRAGR
jgi:hypothetical protein